MDNEITYTTNLEFLRGEMIIVVKFFYDGKQISDDFFYCSILSDERVKEEIQTKINKLSSHLYQYKK